MEAPSQQSTLVYVGSYTRRGSEGIYVFRLDPDSGALEPASSGPLVDNPSFLAFHPSAPFLYAVNETATFQGQEGGGLSAFSVDQATGALTLLNQRPTGASAPCYVSVDPSGTYALVANYGVGSLAVFPIEADGSLGERSDLVWHEGSSVHPTRQEGPHAHCIIVDPFDRFVLATDLGLDRILVYRLNREQGKLEPHTRPWSTVKAGAGPRHLAFTQDGRYVYAINELDSTMTALRYHAEDGVLSEIQSLPTLPEGFSGTNYPAHVAVAPSGRFLYGSNRGHDSIVIYAIDSASGRLSLVGHESTQGRNPRNFSLDPSGRWMLVAHQDSDNVTIFAVDPDTGKLSFTGQEVRVPAGVCVRMHTL